MINMEPSFVLYAPLLDPGCCLRAHIILIELVEPGEKKRYGQLHERDDDHVEKEWGGSFHPTPFQNWGGGGG